MEKGLGLLIRAWGRSKASGGMAPPGRENRRDEDAKPVGMLGYVGVGGGWQPDTCKSVGV